MSHNIAEEKYVSLTSFKRDGSAVAAPVWIADLGDGTVGFTTQAHSYKVKRIGRNPNVTLQPCNMKGDVKPGTSIISGTAKVVTGDEFSLVASKIKAKYGIQFSLVRAQGRIMSFFGKGETANAGVVVTLD